MKKILVAGDIMLDVYHFGKVNRISPEAPVPVFLETGEKREAPGGAANVAVNLAAIGMGTDLFGRIGEDREGRQLLASLQEKKVGTHLIYRAKDTVTTSKLRYIGPNNQQVLRADTEDDSDTDVKEMETLLDAVSGQIAEYSLILLSDYKKGFLTKETVQYLIGLGRKQRIPVLVDVKSSDPLKYKDAYLLKPNRKELGELTGMAVHTMAEVEAAAKALCQRANSNYVLTTLGEDGMLLTDAKDTRHVLKSMAREVFDVTGAGDTVIAYLAAELAKGKELFQAVNTANYAAGIQVSKVGTSIVYPWEVEAAMQDRGALFNEKQLNYYSQNGLAAIHFEQKSGRKIVFTNGCFDILHAGHIMCLKKAKEMGDILVVGINSDASVKRLKGKERPVNPLPDRAMLLAALEFVDYVVPFEEDTPYELIRRIVPDVLVKGGDYGQKDIVGKDIVEAHGGIVATVPLMEGKSTTGIIRKMEEG